MPRYALIKNGVLDGLREFPSRPPNIAHKSVVWLPCPTVTPPSFDEKIESRSGPTYTIGATEVTEVWTVTALSPQEISNQKEAAVSSVNGNYMPQRRLNLNFHNRLRALESQPAHTMPQFLAFWQALL